MRPIFFHLYISRIYEELNLHSQVLCGSEHNLAIDGEWVPYINGNVDCSLKKLFYQVLIA